MKEKKYTEANQEEDDSINKPNAPDSAPDTAPDSASASAPAASPIGAAANIDRLAKVLDLTRQQLALGSTKFDTGNVLHLLVKALDEASEESPPVLL